MRKKDVLRYIPQAKELAKEATLKGREGLKLTNEASRAKEISDALKGVVLHNDFPIRVTRHNGDFEILSGCDEVKRSAYVGAEGNRYHITTYQNNGQEGEIGGTPIDGEFKKAEALTIAKDFVAYGRKTRPQTKKRVSLT